MTQHYLAITSRTLSIEFLRGIDKVLHDMVRCKMALKQTGRKVKSVQTALNIVEFLQEHDGATLSEICEQFDFARSTGHSYLSTLESMEYVTKDGKKYRLSLKFLSHGIAAKNSVSISKLSKDILEELAEKTGAVAWLVVEEHGRAVFLENAIADDAVRTYGRISKRTHLHIIAGGKVILAFMDETDRQNIFDNYGLPAETEHTLTNPTELGEELESIVSEMYASSEHEAALGVCSIAAPILYEGDILGAVQLSSLASHLEDEEFDQHAVDVTIESAAEIADLYAKLAK